MLTPKNGRSRPVTKLCLALEAFRRTDAGRVRDAKAFLRHYFPGDRGATTDRLFLHMPKEVRAALLSGWGIRGKKSALRDDDERVRATVADALAAGDIDATTVEEGVTPEILIDWTPLEDWWAFWRGAALPASAVQRALAVGRDLSLFDERWFLENLKLASPRLEGTDVICAALSKDQIVAWLSAVHASGDASPTGLVAALGWETILSKTAHEALTSTLDALARQIGLADPAEADRPSGAPKAISGRPAAIAAAATASAPPATAAVTAATAAPTPPAATTAPTATTNAAATTATAAPTPPAATATATAAPTTASAPPATAAATATAAPTPPATTTAPTATATAAATTATAAPTPPAATAPVATVVIAAPTATASAAAPTATAAPSAAAAPATTATGAAPIATAAAPVIATPAATTTATSAIAASPAASPPAARAHTPKGEPPAPPATKAAAKPPPLPAAAASPPARAPAPIEHLPSVIIEPDPPAAITAPAPPPPTSAPPSARVLFGAPADPPPMRPPARTLSGVGSVPPLFSPMTPEVAIPSFDVPPEDPAWAPPRAEPGDMGWDIVYGVKRPMSNNVQPKYNFDDDDEPTSEIALPGDPRRP